MKKLLILLAILTTGCATERPKAEIEQRVAWVPCEVEVVRFEDTGKTVAKIVKAQWLCENKDQGDPVKRFLPQL